MQADVAGEVCSPECQAVHVACLGCGVLSGPEHVHVLRHGYCESMLVQVEGGQPPQCVPLFRACAEYAAALPGVEVRHHSRTDHPLRVLREARGLSQRALARRVGLSHKTLARLEAELHRPRPETVRRLAEALDVSPSVLLKLVA